MTEALVVVNLGCGHKTHPDMTNIDFEATSREVIQHNLTSKLPFQSDTVDLVYHANVLEHFGRLDGINFRAENYRVLKSGGLLRICVPDMENICKEYNLVYNIKNE